MIQIQVADAVDVHVGDDRLVVELEEGRAISLPLSSYPRMLYGRPEERNNYQLIGGGSGTHWPDLDEDLCVEDLLAGIDPRRARQLFKDG